MYELDDLYLTLPGTQQVIESRIGNYPVQLYIIDTITWRDQLWSLYFADLEIVPTIKFDYDLYIKLRKDPYAVALNASEDRNFNFVRSRVGFDVRAPRDDEIILSSSYPLIVSAYVKKINL